MNFNLVKKLLKSFFQGISKLFYALLDISSITLVNLSELEGCIISLESLKYCCLFHNLNNCMY